MRNLKTLGLFNNKIYFSGLTRPALYPFAGGQYPYPMLSSDMSQVASWYVF